MKYDRRINLVFSDLRNSQTSLKVSEPHRLRKEQILGKISSNWFYLQHLQAVFSIIKTEHSLPVKLLYVRKMTNKLWIASDYTWFLFASFQICPPPAKAAEYVTGLHTGLTSKTGIQP